MNATNGDTRPRPIFIIGAPRSGTSILTWCLAQHSNILIVPETNWIAALGSQLNHLYGIGSASGFYSQLSNFETSRKTFCRSFGEMIHKLVRNGFEARYASERERLRSGGLPDPVRAWVSGVDDPKLRWVDGTPANSAYVAAIDDMFPDAQYVHLTRNPDAVVDSLVSNALLSAQFPTAGDAVRYVFHARRAAHLSEVAFGREKVIRADLDRILTAPDAEFARILEHLGEIYEPRCKNPLQKRINSTQEHGRLEKRYKRDAATGRLMQRLREWQDAGASTDWTLPVDVNFAREELLTYASIPINAPASQRKLRLD